MPLVAPTDVAVRPKRSAFAAAFLSFVFPGLGHLYIGRWLRALLWAALPIIGIAAGAGLALSYSRDDLIELVADPDFLNALLIFLVIDLLYRLVAMLDAYRLASDGSIGNASTRILSIAGLLALVVVLIGSHIAIARPVMFATDVYAAIEDNAGDESEVLSAEELVAQGGKQFELITEELTEQKTPKPRASLDPDATPKPTKQPTPEPTEEATPAQDGATPQPRTADWDGTDRLNILLIGQDGGRQGRNDGSLLTDTMITVSIDPATGRLAFISLPRDASNIPLPRDWAAYRALGGKWNNKINTLYTQARTRPDLFPGNDKQRGYQALMGALGELYGLDIEYYMAVDLNSFRAVVTTLGGVVVDVQLPVMDTGYATGDGRGKLKLYVQPGMRKLNGQDALAYARSRHGSSDFDRSARQQRVITSVRDQTDIDQLLEPGVVTELIKNLQKDVKTNIPPKLVPKLLTLAQSIDLEDRENLVLSSSKYVETCYPCGSSGLWMLKAKPSTIRADVKNIFSTSRAKQRAINKVRDEGAVVYVLNGQGGRNLKAIKIASNLSGKGMDAIVPPVNDGKAEASDFGSTVIRVYNGADKDMPETFKKLKSALNDKKRTVELIDDENAQADFIVVVGSKTKALKA
jgi:polyisoprenyl-teichoic acid--peptidoglycan teichoic acid transferase